MISHINQKNETESFSLTEQELLAIYKLNEVKAIEPIVIKSAIINKDNNIKGVIIKGIDLEYKNQLIQNYIIEGEYLSQDKKNELLISKEQAQKLKLKIGDNCILYFLSQNSNIQKLFTITGIFDMKNAVFNNNYCFSKQATLQKINKWSTRI